MLSNNSSSVMTDRLTELNIKNKNYSLPSIDKVLKILLGYLVGIYRYKI